MSRVSRGILVCAAAALCAASSPLAARQRTQTAPNEPGMPTIARMYILNRGADEAVPVTIHNSADVLPVAVMSVPPVTLSSSTTITAQAGRQVWEYRQVEVTTGEDLAATLNRAGLDGWEAVAVTTGEKARQVLMKRPR